MSNEEAPHQSAGDDATLTERCILAEDMAERVGSYRDNFQVGLQAFVEPVRENLEIATVVGSPSPDSLFAGRAFQAGPIPDPNAFSLNSNDPGIAQLSEGAGYRFPVHVETFSNFPVR